MCFSTKRQLNKKTSPETYQRNDAYDITPLVKWGKRMKNVFLPSNNVTSGEKVFFRANKRGIVQMGIQRKGLNQVDQRGEFHLSRVSL